METGNRVNDDTEGSNTDEDTVGDTDLTERELKILFWKLVALFNIGPISLVAGIMMTAFDRPSTEFGIAVLAFGSVVTLRGLIIYYRKAPKNLGKSSESGD